MRTRISPLHTVVARLLTACVLLAMVLAGCSEPGSATSSDSGGADAFDVGDDRSVSDDRLGERDVLNDLATATDVLVPRCVPGMTIGCLCDDTRMGVQTCGIDGVYGVCRCPMLDGGLIEADT